jgi:hypothetical protein
MNKVIPSMAILILSTFSAQSQTFAEWFEQDKTQIKYLLAQVAAYEVFQDELKTGYGIEQLGLSFVADTPGAEFSINNAYFSSLKAVNPAISTYPKVKTIIDYASAINRNLNRALQAKNIDVSEMNYLNAVYNSMAIDCSKSIDELITVLTADRFTMNDNDRLSCIDAIYNSMKDRYAFSQSFCSEALLLSAQRESEISDIDESLINNGLR